MPSTGPSATTTFGPPLYFLIALTAASIGSPGAVTVPDAMRIADAGGSIGALLRLIVVKAVSVTGTPVIDRRRAALAR